MEKATQQQIKEQNRNLVLKLLFESPSTSRAELARISRLTRTTVSDIVSGLIEEGLVNEIGTGSSIGGKSPILLQLVADSRHIIGLDLAQKNFTGATVNLLGQIRNTVSRPIHEQDGDKALQVLYEIIDQLILQNHQQIVGISLGTPGLVNTREGTVIHSVNMEWRDFPIGPLLKARYHLPVNVLNDCQAAAMGEYRYGSRYPANTNMIVVRVGVGIGAGIILNGQIFQGDNGYAGEIGHVVCVHDKALPCRCGNLGCLETMSSSLAVVQRAEMLTRSTRRSKLNAASGQISLDILESAYQDGDELACQIIYDSGHYLGEAIASLVAAYNVDKVILTGIMTRFGDPWLKVVQDTAVKNILPRLAQDITIEVGHLKNDEAILGASAILASNYSLLFNH